MARMISMMRSGSSLTPTVMSKTAAEIAGHVGDGGDGAERHDVNRAIDEPDGAHGKGFHTARQAAEGDRVACLHGVFQQQNRPVMSWTSFWLPKPMARPTTPAPASRGDVHPDLAQHDQPAMRQMDMSRAVRAMGAACSRAERASCFAGRRL